MNKSELIEALAPRLGGRTQAATAVEAMVDLILREVAAGRTVGVTGFGTFEKVDRAPRTGRNPRTGEPVPIAGTSTPRFRPGAYFKDVVADPSALPAQGLAGARVGSDGRLERTGAPSSVRRAAGAPREDGERGRPEGSRKGGRGQRTGRSRSGSKGFSGTPDSVRKDADTVEDAGGARGADGTPVAATGRVMSGGEDITMGMISAKKAQLARVKNDELAAKRQKQAKKEKKKGKKAGGKGAAEAAGAKPKKDKRSTGQRPGRKTKGKGGRTR